MLEGQIASTPRLGTWANPVLFARGEIMPASKADLADLRAILWYLENPQTKVKDPDRRRHCEALRRMLEVLEYGDPASPIWWTAGALCKSTRKTLAGRYIVTDLPLHTWSLDQIHAFFPEPDA